VPDDIQPGAGEERAFRLLGDRLARRGLVADIYVFAGAAMALAYDARRATRDTDAVCQTLKSATLAAEQLEMAKCRGYW